MIIDNFFKVLFENDSIKNIVMVTIKHLQIIDLIDFFV